MKQQLSKGALRTRDRFFVALRTMSLRDMSTARLARRVEHEINEVLFQIERFAASHKYATVRSPAASERIAARWLDLAAQCVEIDADLADIVTLFARHWLLCAVVPARGKQWVQRAECVIRALSIRSEQRGSQQIRDVTPIDSQQPLVTLVLCGLPRGTQPMDVEVDLGHGAVIGRAEDCDWILPGEVVSRHHARLRYDTEQRTFFVANLSRNGLGVDEAITLQEGETELSVGMMLRVPKEGQYKILVQSVFVPVSALLLNNFDSGAKYFNMSDDADDASLELRDVDSDDQVVTRLEPMDQDSIVPLAKPRALPVFADAERDPDGVVHKLYEQYAFLAPDAGEVVRSYVHGETDAAALVATVFSDVLLLKR